MRVTGLVVEIAASDRLVVRQRGDEVIEVHLEHDVVLQFKGGIDHFSKVAGTWLRHAKTLHKMNLMEENDP